MKKPLTDADGTVRELTSADVASMKPFDQVFPGLAATMPKRRRGQRGLGKLPAKVQITLRLDPDVLESWRSTGEGWRTRMNEALKSALTASHP